MLNSPDWFVIYHIGILKKILSFIAFVKHSGLSRWIGSIVTPGFENFESALCWIHFLTRRRRNRLGEVFCFFPAGLSGNTAVRLCLQDHLDVFCLIAKQEFPYLSKPVKFNKTDSMFCYYQLQWPGLLILEMAKRGQSYFQVIFFDTNFLTHCF